MGSAATLLLPDRFDYVICIGAGLRVEIPECLLTKVRLKFSNAAGVIYVGFHEIY